MLLHPDHPFHSKDVVRKRKIPAIAHVIGQDSQTCSKIKRRRIWKNIEKIALLLLQPHRSSEQLLGNKKLIQKHSLVSKIQNTTNRRKHRTFCLIYSNITQKRGEQMIYEMNETHSATKIFRVQTKTAGPNIIKKFWMWKLNLRCHGIMI